MTKMEQSGDKCHVIEHAAFLLRPYYAFLTALSFLTRLPVLQHCIVKDPLVWRQSFLFYPLTGAVIGALAALPVVALLIYVPEKHAALLASSVLYLFILEWLTRFLHFDGFCDVCDAFAAMNATPEKRLALMKDPHTGSAALGCGALLIAAKVLILYLIFTRIVLFPNPGMICFILIMIPVLSRFAMLISAACGKYPRPEGTGKMIVGQVGVLPLFFLLLLFCFLVMLFFALFFRFQTLLVFSSLESNLLIWKNNLASLSVQSPSEWLRLFVIGGFQPWVLVMLAMFGPVFYWHRASDKKLGGITGDVLGAVHETSELALMFAFLLIVD